MDINPNPIMNMSMRENMHENYLSIKDECQHEWKYGCDCDTNINPNIN